MCLKCLLELGITDALKKQGKPIEQSELASALSISPSKFELYGRFMTTLVHLELFAKKQDDSGATKYKLTPAFHLLVKYEAMNVTPLIFMNLHPAMCDSSRVLAPWFKSPEETPFEFYFGKMFNEGMASDSKLVWDVVMTTCKDVFKGLKSVVDVGGETGTMARAIRHAFLEIKCTVLDLPHVIDTLEDQQPGVEYTGGDMFASVPHANAVLLKDDNSAALLIRVCLGIRPWTHERLLPLIPVSVVLLLGPAHLWYWTNNWAPSPWFAKKKKKAMLTYGGGLDGNVTRVSHL
ncbi:putative O-methyltransferase domain, plant methyltransferase dimerization [Dioscorea sansibarensis]